MEWKGWEYVLLFLMCRVSLYLYSYNLVRLTDAALSGRSRCRSKYMCMMRQTGAALRRSSTKNGPSSSSIHPATSASRQLLLRYCLKRFEVMFALFHCLDLRHESKSSPGSSRSPFGILFTSHRFIQRSRLQIIFKMATRKDSQQRKPWIDAIVTHGLDPDGSYGKWLRDHLSPAFEHLIDPTVIQEAFDDKFPQNRLSTASMAALVASMFPTAALVDGGPPWPMIEGVRWTKLDDGKCVRSEGTQHTSLPVQLTNESHKLLYLPQPSRTVWWLRMLFKKDDTASFGTLSMWKLYEHCTFRALGIRDVKRTSCLLTIHSFS